MLKPTEHKKHLSHNIPPVKFALFSTSDTRTPKTDKTGRLIISLLEKAKHHCIGHKIVKNNVLRIRSNIRLALKSDASLIITSGGTGCGRKDITIEAITPFISKRLEGFGELFRFLSYRQIGSSAIMSRALLGITKNNKIICAVPGSPDAVSLALKKLIIPELPHIIWEVHRHSQPCLP